MRIENTSLFVAYWQALTEAQALQTRNAIVEDFIPRIKRLAWRYVYLDQRDICADMEQDLYVAALEIVPTIPRWHPAPGGYLYHILKLRWQGRVRVLLDERDLHLASVEAPLADDGFCLAHVLAAPNPLALNDQASSRLQAALTWLPPLQQIVIQERYQFANIAFQTPPDGLSSRWRKDALAKAYRALRKRLSSPAIDPRVCSECGTPLTGAQTTKRQLCENWQCHQAHLRRWQQTRKAQVQE